VPGLDSESTTSSAFWRSRSARRWRRSEASLGLPEDRPRLRVPVKSASSVAAILFALSGAVALVFEITWTRVFGLVFGSSVYSFALICRDLSPRLAIGNWRSAGASPPARIRGVPSNPASRRGGGSDLDSGSCLPSGSSSALFAEREHVGASPPARGRGSACALPCIAFGALFRSASAPGRQGCGASATGRAYAASTAGR
jgi:hypothetical protein